MYGQEGDKDTFVEKVVEINKDINLPAALWNDGDFPDDIWDAPFDPQGSTNQDRLRAYVYALIKYMQIDKDKRPQTVDAYPKIRKALAFAQINN